MRKLPTGLLPVLSTEGNELTCKLKRGATLLFKVLEYKSLESMIGQGIYSSLQQVIIYN